MKCFNSASQQELILSLRIFSNVCRHLGFHIGIICIIQPKCQMHSKMKNYPAQMSVMPRLRKPALQRANNSFPSPHILAPALSECYRLWRTERTLRTEVFWEISREQTRLELICEESRTRVRDVEAQGAYENWSNERRWGHFPSFQDDRLSPFWVAPTQ